MKAGKQQRREAKQLFQACLANGQLNAAHARQVVDSLVRTKPRGYMDILSHFARLVALELARRTVTVESPVALADGLKRSLEQSLTRLHGAGLQIQYAENPGLLGGIRIKVGSDVYDGSVRSRLAQLQESF